MILILILGQLGKGYEIRGIGMKVDSDYSVV